MDQWFKLNHPDQVPSPALLIYLDRVRYNIELMIKIAGSEQRLRPHVKTHKLPELVALQASYGIKKFKCATIAEAEMVAQSGGKDVLLAYQPVGPNIERLVTLKDTYPEVHFSCIVDNEDIIQAIAQAATKYKSPMHLYLDIDNGMHRTGVSDLGKMVELVTMIYNTPDLMFKGLHIYDGHIHEPDLELRREQCMADFAIVDKLISVLDAKGIIIPNLITGGTPTMPIHAQFANRELSPGTPLLWDVGYGEAFKDLPFKHAAVIMARVISEPLLQRVCLDLGYKSISSEMQHPRIHLLNINDYEVETHSEEHMVIKLNNQKLPKIGDIVYGIPTHICPSVALYENGYIIDNHTVIDNWKIAARQRKITV